MIKNVISIKVFKLIKLHLIKLNSTGSFIVVGRGIQVLSHMTIDDKMAIEKADKVLTSSSLYS